MNEWRAVWLALLAAGVMTAAVHAQSAPVQDCKAFIAGLRIDRRTRSGAVQPRFMLTLRNTSKEPFMFLDVRKGRRSDLADAYYTLEIERNGIEPEELRRAICDPGPIADEDFFTLRPGESVEFEVFTCADLTGLQRGRYTARVLVRQDPFSSAVPRCRSSAASIDVTR